MHGVREYDERILMILPTNTMPHPTALPANPPRALLISMAMRLRHDFGMDRHKAFPGLGMTPDERRMMLDDMARCYEEVVGLGFYRWDGARDEFYNAVDITPQTTPLSLPDTIRAARGHDGPPEQPTAFDAPTP